MKYVMVLALFFTLSTPMSLHAENWIQNEIQKEIQNEIENTRSDIFQLADEANKYIANSVAIAGLPSVVEGKNMFGAGVGFSGDQTSIAGRIGTNFFLDSNHDYSITVQISGASCGDNASGSVSAGFNF